jgi:hypothetical protein
MGYPDPPGCYMIQEILFKKSPWCAIVKVNVVPTPGVE